MSDHPAGVPLINLLLACTPEQLVEGTVLGVSRLDGREFQVVLGKQQPAEDLSEYELTYLIDPDGDEKRAAFRNEVFEAACAHRISIDQAIEAVAQEMLEHPGYRGVLVTYTEDGVDVRLSDKVPYGEIHYGPRLPGAV